MTFDYLVLDADLDSVRLITDCFKDYKTGKVVQTYSTFTLVDKFPVVGDFYDGYKVVGIRKPEFDYADYDCVFVCLECPSSFVWISLAIKKNQICSS